MWKRNFILEKSFSLFSVYILLSVLLVGSSALFMINAIESEWSIFAGLSPATYLALMAIASTFILDFLFFFMIVLEKRENLKEKEAEYRGTIYVLFAIKWGAEALICYPYYESVVLFAVAGFILNMIVGGALCSCLLELVKGIKYTINVLQEIMKSYR